MIVDIEYATIRWIENNIMLPDMAQKNQQSNPATCNYNPELDPF